MNTAKGQIAHAHALRDAIIAAPTIWIPRRDIMVEWIDALLLRSKEKKFECEAKDSESLVELETFLRAQDVPVAA